MTNERNEISTYVLSRVAGMLNSKRKNAVSQATIFHIFISPRVSQPPYTHAQQNRPAAGAKTLRAALYVCSAFI